jgi:hypothetical protein
LKQSLRIVVTAVVVMILPRAGWGENGTGACTLCHADKASLLAGSAHKTVSCQECHGGGDTYSLTPEQVAAYQLATPGESGRPPFDHGPDFAGRANRADVPQLCGGCHADVQRMNPYGIRTDQLAAYWTSGHGRALKERGEDRVAVCIDCHGSHDILPPGEPDSKTNPLNVVDTCAVCHSDADLMAEFGIPVEIIDEYSGSVHGDLLLEQGDTGAPTCATCHGNHAAVPPGFATVGAVCGQCHQRAAEHFSTSIHAEEEEFNGCIQCHGGGPDAHSHRISRITRPTSLLVQRQAFVLASDHPVTRSELVAAIHPEPRDLIAKVMPTCTECHDEPEEDESLQRLTALLGEISVAELEYLETAIHLDRVAQGVLLVDSQRFKLDDAKTMLIGLAPLQHTLDNDLVSESVAKLNEACDEIRAELTGLESALQTRRQALIPIWIFALAFSVALYAKYKQLRRKFVKPLPGREH